MENNEAVILYAVMEYRAPVSQTREPWDPVWYEFWKAKGYYMNFWGFHLPVVAVFLILSTK